MKKIICAVLFFLIMTFLSAENGSRKDFFVTIEPIQGTRDSFLLFCSAEELSAKKNASSIFTTRLPTLPLKLGKWTESIYVIPGMKSPLQTICLKENIKFTFPVVGISRKVLLEKDPDFPGEYRLSIYWYDGKYKTGMVPESFRIWSVISLVPGKTEKIASLKVEQ